MRGYSLIELLVVIAIIGVIGTVVVTSYKGLLNVQNPMEAARTFYFSLEDASLRARMMQLDSPWGVAIVAGKVITFKGGTYATRDTTQDRLITISSQVTSVGITEVDFAKFTGVPNATGTTTFSSTLASSSVYVLPGGTISH